VRVLFTTTGHSGHLLPLVPLARACKRAGHDVLIATHAPRADNVERLGLPVHPIEVAPDEAWAPVMSRLPGLPQSDGDALIVAEGFARIGAGRALPGFLEDGERRVFDPPQDAVIAALAEALGRVLDEARFAEVARRLGDEMAGLPPADAAAAALAA
jgi:UDP:flavonoid glycosyltransferase YjiC (YdhE family)